MTQKEKQLLLTDLSARLSYDVLVLNKDGDVESFTWQELKEFEDGYISKPYLRPMSSMTEDEKAFYEYHKEGHCSSGWATALVDWLNAHHFDYRGLIEKGLALEAPEGMYD
jgi:hypothetical protein